MAIANPARNPTSTKPKTDPISNKINRPLPARGIPANRVIPANSQGYAATIAIRIDRGQRQLPVHPKWRAMVDTRFSLV